MRDRVEVVSTRAIPARHERAVTAVREIKNIERTEVKADAVTVMPDGPTTGSYTVRGHFAGVPWRGKFFYELNSKGFHSRNAAVPGKGSTIEGGFIVEPLGDDECLVIHYEEYTLPAYLRPLRVAIAAYLKWSMRRELRDLSRLVLDSGSPVSSSISPQRA